MCDPSLVAEERAPPVRRPPIGLRNWRQRATGVEQLLPRMAEGDSPGTKGWTSHGWTVGTVRTWDYLDIRKYMYIDITDITDMILEPSTLGIWMIQPKATHSSNNKWTDHHTSRTDVTMMIKPAKSALTIGSSLPPRMRSQVIDDWCKSSKWSVHWDDQCHLGIIKPD